MECHMINVEWIMSDCGILLINIINIITLDIFRSIYSYE